MCIRDRSWKHLLASPPLKGASSAHVIQFIKLHNNIYVNLDPLQCVSSKLPFVIIFFLHVIVVHRKMKIGSCLHANFLVHWIWSNQFTILLRGKGSTKLQYCQFVVHSYCWLQVSPWRPALHWCSCTSVRPHFYKNILIR